MSAKRKAESTTADGEQARKKLKAGIPNTQKDGTVQKKKMAKDTAASRRERKISRKSQKPNFELSKQTLRLWEKLRRSKSKISKKERTELVKELMNAVKTQDKKLISLMYAHDTSRVLQSCLKQGSPEQRQAIYEELKDEIINMSKNRYSKNMVWKFLKYGTPKQRNEIIHRFAGLVPKLIRKQGPASIIEFAYNVYANKEQRNFLAQQLYGNSFNISKSSEQATLEDVLNEQPQKKALILGNFKQSLLPLIDKQVITHTIVHRVFKEFFTFCDEEQLRSEMIEMIRESVIHMMHTRDGAHVAMQCLWHGTAKDRKVIVKTMKEFISKLCQEEYGHLVLLAAFDSVDDTVFINKALITPIVKLLPEIIGNKFSKKVLLYLVSPRNKSHFLPETIKFLSQGDGNKHSKKPIDVRHKELSEAVSPGLISHINNNLENLIRDKSLFVLVEAAVNFCQADGTKLISSLNDMLSLPFEAGSKDKLGKMHIIEDPAGHLLIKRLVSHKPELESKVSYAKYLLDSVSEESILSWASCNRGSQVLLSLIQCPADGVAIAAKKLLKRNIKTLKRHKEIKSTIILVEKLEE